MIQQLEQAIIKLSELSQTEQEEIAQMILSTIESKKQSANAWDTLEEMAGSIEAPEDWSKEHDHYLYGTPKNNNNEQ
ncbi:hypothetical protein VKI22_02020 [Cyanobacterium aponinum UTEX 3221]|uniref:hypothetical protein n=1 Tax=Cyanobacterium aponinum TaxID=379064 RepID=UPI002B4BF3AC|nr:hypothetical protein [Cyanobacterium aponinum]WRL38895.1 hypothetical protein VKI22_02020 [Cyanobacterium aponinum UTEX 3221]